MVLGQLSWQGGGLVPLQHLRARQLWGLGAAEVARRRYRQIPVSGINWETFQRRWDIPPPLGKCVRSFPRLKSWKRFAPG